MTNKGKPFIKWVGGKTQLIDSIENTLPKDFENQTNLTYIEPFVGGGAILFWILQKYPNIKKAVINDINPDLTTAYKTIWAFPLRVGLFVPIFCSYLTKVFPLQSLTQS